MAKKTAAKKPRPKKAGVTRGQVVAAGQRLYAAGRKLTPAELPPWLAEVENWKSLAGKYVKFTPHRARSHCNRAGPGHVGAYATLEGALDELGAGA